uniref:Carboxylesterase type B domain-containing protein n=1 Tax=Acrobeloides nanus TaxID=290746 RepID=A0A914CM09_9BILA
MRRFHGAETTWFFTGPAGEEVSYYLQNNNPNVYLYEFTYASYLNNLTHTYPGYNPVVHGAQSEYVGMGYSSWLRSQANGKINATDIAIANFFGETWTNFAKFGKPTLDDTWKPVKSSGLTSMEYMEIGANIGMRTGYRTNDRTQYETAALMAGQNRPQTPKDVITSSATLLLNPTLDMFVDRILET